MRSYFRFILLFIATFIFLAQSFSQRTRFRDRDRGEAGANPVAPDYSKMHSWASHPTIHDMGDSIPAPLRKEYSYDGTIDVFFIHPTTYIQKEDGQMNADLNNEYVNRRTNTRTILNQASAFNEYRLFAPRYRQANYSAYMSFGGGYQSVFDTAYADVKKAFQYYLSHWNQGHSYFIASHSQGSQHAVRLIKELIEGTEWEKKLVAAYIIGIPPMKAGKLKTPVCNDSTQTGCYVAWNSFTDEFRQQFNFLGRSDLETVNPLTWKTTETPASAKLHKGAVVNDFNSVKRNALSTEIKASKLVVSSDSDTLELPGSLQNLHVLDINLFYVDIRNNLRTRVAAYKAKNRSL
jgi:hypothetical protein